MSQSSEDKDYELTHNSRSIKAVWEENGSERQFKLAHKSGRVPHELALLSEYGDLPEEIEEMVEEVGYDSGRVNLGEKLFKRKGMLHDDELIGIPHETLDDVWDRYFVEDGKLKFEHNLTDQNGNGRVEKTEDNYDEEQVLDYLSSDERTGFWDLARYINTEIYDGGSGPSTIGKTGELIDALENEYDQVDGDKEEGYWLVE